MSASTPIVFYLYHAFDTPEARKLLLERFRATGHTRPIEIRKWDCMNEKPPRGGDLYLFDAVTLSYLCTNSYLREMPEILDKQGIFEWTLDTTKYRRHNYGLPVMLCADVIISRRAQDPGTAHIDELPGRVAAPIKSLAANYYLGYKINQSGDTAEAALSAMDKMCQMIGGPAELPKARVSQNYGIAEFDRGEVDHYVGFTEALRQFHPDDYVVRKTQYSSQTGDEISFLYVNMVALGKDAREETLLDCIDLMEILSSPAYEQALCWQDGALNYMLPANQNAYPPLIAQDPLYTQLLAVADAPNNVAFRASADYYEHMETLTSTLVKRMQGKI